MVLKNRIVILCYSCHYFVGLNSLCYFWQWASSR